MVRLLGSFPRTSWWIGSYGAAAKFAAATENDDGRFAMLGCAANSTRRARARNHHSKKSTVTRRSEG